MDETLLTKRRYKDGDNAHLPWQEEIFVADTSHQCPTYVHRTPPCQGSCPAGEDIRGWLNIARGLEKPPAAFTIVPLLRNISRSAPGSRTHQPPRHAASP